MMRLALLAVFLALPIMASGQSITNVTGTVADDDTLYVIGSGFKVKGVAAPLRYMDFQEGVEGNSIPQQEQGGLWHQTGVRDVTYSGDIQRIDGDMCALQDWGNASRPDNNRQMGFIDIPCDTLYWTGWTYRYDNMGTAMDAVNAKIWGNFFTHDETGFHYPGSRYDMYPVNPSGHMEANDYDSSNLINNYIGCYMYLDQWARVERGMLMGTQSGGDGLTWASGNLVELGRMEGTFFTGGDEFNHFYVGNYFQSPACLQAYWSEIYADTTLARVEIGDNAVWSSCTHREMQVPFFWAADGDSIGIELNQGTFENASTAYVFVVDRNGDYSTGYQVTWGGAAGYGGTASEPSGLDIVED